MTQASTPSATRAGTPLKVSGGAARPGRYGIMDLPPEELRRRPHELSP